MTTSVYYYRVNGKRVCSVGTRPIPVVELDTSPLPHRSSQADSDSSNSPSSPEWVDPPVDIDEMERNTEQLTQLLQSCVDTLSTLKGQISEFKKQRERGRKRRYSDSSDDCQSESCARCDPWEPDPMKTAVANPGRRILEMHPHYPLIKFTRVETTTPNEPQAAPDDLENNNLEVVVKDEPLDDYEDW